MTIAAPWHWEMLFKLLCVGIDFQVPFSSHVTTNRFQMHPKITQETWRKITTLGYHHHTPSHSVPSYTPLREYDWKISKIYFCRICFRRTRSTHTHETEEKTDLNLRALFRLFFFLFVLRCRFSVKFEHLILDIFISVWLSEFIVHWAMA